MKDRIRQLMEAQHMNQQTFASFTGIGTASLSSIFTGRTRPTLNHVDAILEKFPNVSPMWLLKGQGGMLLSANEQKNADGSPAAGGADGGENTSGTQADGNSRNSANVSHGLNATNTLNTPTAHIQNIGISGGKNAINPQMEAEKKAVLPPRKITEIRVFYDDQTWESFVPKKEK